MSWQTVAAAKRAEIWQDSPPTWKISDPALAAASSSPDGTAVSVVNGSLSPAELAITARPTSQLLAALAAGDLTASEVLEAFAHRAMVAHQLTNCLSESNLTAARVAARELDAHWRANAAPVGPLHGLPVSLMDRFSVAGLDSACAFVSWIGRKQTAADEGSLLTMLRHLGAIVLCKTNIPQSMMLGETSNNIIGTTTNPFNLNLSAGGACGGEGALLALNASRLGFGTDIAGSSRIPAAFCGIWSLKCSQHRLPDDGIATVLHGIPTASGALALLSNDFATLMSTFKLLVDSRLPSASPNVLELPWRQEKWDAIQRRRGHPNLGNGRLVFGVLSCDGTVRPHPSIQRGIDIASKALEAAGHEMIAWDPPAHGPAVNNLFEIFGSTSAIEARTAIDASGEPPIFQIADWYHHQDVEPNSTLDFWNLCARRNDFCTQYKAYWNNFGGSTRSGRIPDGVILPVAPTLAVRPGEFLYYGYSAIVNVLDYPSGVFPVTFGDRSLDVVPEGFEPLSELDEQVHKTFRTDDHHGMPVALQVMCPRLQEETVLALMEVIVDSMHSYQSPS